MNGTNVTSLFLIIQKLVKRPGEIGRLAFPTYTPVTKRRLDRNPRAQRPAYSSPVPAFSGRPPADGARSGGWWQIGSVARASEKRGDDHAMTPIFSDAIIPVEQTSSAVLGAQMRADCRSGGQ